MNRIGKTRQWHKTYFYWRSSFIWHGCVMWITFIKNGFLGPNIIWIFLFIIWHYLFFSIRLLFTNCVLWQNVNLLLDLVIMAIEWRSQCVGKFTKIGRINFSQFKMYFRHIIFWKYFSCFFNLPFWKWILENICSTTFDKKWLIRVIFFKNWRHRRPRLCISFLWIG